MRAYEFLLLELTDKVKNLLRDRYQQENPQLQSNIIDEYLNKWDRFAGSVPKEYRDITRLSFDQVKQIIDDAEFKSELKGKQKSSDVQDKPVYDNNNLVIFKGDNKPRCIQYGRGYTWCISRSDASNLFYSYRMSGTEPVFYFVFDKERDKPDPYHAVVIYVTNDGEYFMDTALNQGDKKYSWQELVQAMPKLAQAKSVFKPQPLNDTEHEEYEMYRYERDLDEYEEMSMREKYKYFMFGHELTPEQQAVTPDELIGVYAKNHIPSVEQETWERLKPNDQKKIQYDAAQHGSTAAPFAINILGKPWFLTGLSYAKQTDRLINELDDSQQHYDYYDLVEMAIMENQKQVMDWMENADPDWVADVSKFYYRLPLFKLSTEKLVNVLKMIYKNYPKWSIDDRVNRAPATANSAIAKFISWTVMENKDVRYLSRHTIKQDILEQIPLRAYRRALRLGAESKRFPQSIQEKLNRTRHNSEKVPKEKWAIQIHALKKLMRDNETVLHALDVDNMDAPDYMKDIIRDYKQQLLAGND